MSWLSMLRREEELQRRAEAAEARVEELLKLLRVAERDLAWTHYCDSHRCNGCGRPNVSEKPEDHDSDCVCVAIRQELARG
jgi:hypothetical protein